jgi:hypothetical protein
MKRFLIIISLLLFIGCSRVNEELPLAAFAGTNKISGSFFLGCGTIDSTPIYRYLWVSSDGGINQNWCYATRTRVYENDLVTPFIRISSLGWFLDEGRNDDWVYITIPKNSVQKNFNLELK